MSPEVYIVPKNGSHKQYELYNSSSTCFKGQKSMNDVNQDHFLVILSKYVMKASKLMLIMLIFILIHESWPKIQIFTRYAESLLPSDYDDINWLVISFASRQIITIKTQQQKQQQQLEESTN